jgi:hypothetical protein
VVSSLLWTLISFTSLALVSVNCLHMHACAFALEKSRMFHRCQFLCYYGIFQLGYGIEYGICKPRMGILFLIGTRIPFSQCMGTSNASQKRHRFVIV